MSFHTHEHNHAHAHSTNTHILRVSLAVIAGFMLVEAAAGWLSGSLALLSDAGHMFSDAASLALALFARRKATAISVWKSWPPRSTASRWW